jgi:hypothetical protein
VNSLHAIVISNNDYVMDYILSRTNFRMRESKSKNINNSLGNYYASNRAIAFMNYNSNTKSIIQDREFGRVFAEYKDKLVIIDGENKKEHAYLIPKTKVHHYGDNQVYFNISQNTLKEFEI